MYINYSTFDFNIIIGLASLDHTEDGPGIDCLHMRHIIPT